MENNMKEVNLTVGYLFLLTGVMGCITIIGLILGFDIFSGGSKWVIFIALEGRGSSMTPLFLAGISAVGAYLVKGSS